MSEDAEVRVECPWCGTLALSPGAVRCADVAPGDRLALCQFTCPVCFRLIILRTTPEGVEVARRVGVADLNGPVPRELLEPHGGPPLTWDDVLDLHLALSRTCCPQEELGVRGPRACGAES